ncbi:hypothetical protein M8J76_016443 [Diaphorina citri]|nr:hypothetical protein M8J75_015054 [Diaphorina citri]KAI5719898.1 hypothetical protein M8J76_016443 [Diaphorina citri]KAI5720560.1 hypothetical protein M8J77_008590 [Diaphorina citri]
MSRLVLITFSVLLVLVAFVSAQDPTTKSDGQALKDEPKIPDPEPGVFSYLYKLISEHISELVNATVSFFSLIYHKLPFVGPASNGSQA